MRRLGDNEKDFAGNPSKCAQFVPNCTSGFRYVVDFMERETGIEPATFSLGS